jgi:hypothetical protein
VTPALWAGLALLAVAAAALLRPRLSPQQQVAALVLAAAIGFAVARMFPIAVPLAWVGVGLWRRAAPAPRRETHSSVETPGLRMTLDHASGMMDGEVLAGRFVGRPLSALSVEALQALVVEFEAAGDEESLALLLAYLERRGVAREAPGQHQPPPPSGGQPMTEAEAYRVLGLEPGASREEVRAAYGRLIRRVHPDLGGSSALAAMLNAAKEALDPG